MLGNVTALEPATFGCSGPSSFCFTPHRGLPSKTFSDSHDRFVTVSVGTPLNPYGT